MLSLYRKLAEKFWRGPVKIGQLTYPKLIPYKSAVVVAAYWLYYFIFRFFTPTGRILFLLTMFIFAYIIFTPARSPVVYFTFMLVSLYLVSLFIGFIFRPKVSLHREVPVFAEVGKSVLASYDLQSRASIKTWDVSIDTIECHMMSYPDGYPYLKECEPGEKYSFTSQIIFHLRGVYRLPCTVAESSFPFSLLRFTCWGGGHNEIMVLPKKIDIQSLSILHYELSKSYSGGSSQEAGLGEEEFRACRDYRNGDSVRQIDWAAWARVGKAVVKEYDDRSTVHIALVLDTHFSLIKGFERVLGAEKIELAISLMAGLSAYLSQQGVLINKLIIADSCFEIDGENQPGLANEEVQKLLAEYKHKEGQSVEDKLDGIEEFLSSESLILSVLLDDSAWKKSFLDRLSEQGAVTKTFCLAKEKKGSEGDFRYLNLKELKCDEGLYL